MQSTAIYSYLDKLILVPKQQWASGITTSQTKFKVISLPMHRRQLWQEILDSLDDFVIHAEDYNRSQSTGFNTKLAKAAGASSYTKFLQKSRVSHIYIDGADCFVEHLAPAKGYKGYQDTEQPPSKYRFNRNSGDPIVDDVMQFLNPDQADVKK